MFCIEMFKVLRIHSYNLDAGCCPLNRVCKGRPGHFVSPYRTGKNSLSIAADFNQKEVVQCKKSNENVWWEEKNSLRSTEKFYCVYVFVLPWVWIRIVWEQTLILVTFCIWPWRRLSSSLSEAAYLKAQCQPTPFTTPLNPLSETPPPAFKRDSYEH